MKKDSFVLFMRDVKSILERTNKAFNREGRWSVDGADSLGTHFKSQFNKGSSPQEAINSAGNLVVDKP